jgi:uncharacterized protein (TIGR01319 family)
MERLKGGDLMKVDYLISEIGSTTTVATAIRISDCGANIIAQGKSYTTVLEGDVNVGLRKAVSDLEQKLGDTIIWDRMFSTSSAAGGLRITVHGLVEDMTVKAAKEAALGAGGNIKLVTSGKLRQSDIKKIKDIDPNLIMIAGGTDFGERETALFNAELLCREKLNKPIIYCGNIANHEEIKELFKGQELYLVDNVYPRIDELNVEPSRRVIQEAFEKNITSAPGMKKIKDMVNGSIMPTPGAVMESAKLIYNILGDVLVIDVGGATTDVHSVTEGSAEILDILVSPEPVAKRTVEGDLGVYVNSSNLINLLDTRDLSGLTKDYISANIKPVPTSEEEIQCSVLLTKKAVNIAVSRHVGYIKRTYGASKQIIAHGKDLSMVKYIIGTGGALTRLPEGDKLLQDIRYSKEDMTMLPRKSAKILLDSGYIIACAGVLSRENRDAAVSLLKQSLGI